MEGVVIFSLLLLEQYGQTHKSTSSISNGSDCRDFRQFVCAVTHFCLVFFIIETEDEESESAGEQELVEEE